MKTYPKKKNTTAIIVTIAIVAFVIGGIYMLGRGSGDPQAGGDPMHPGSATASSGSPNDLVGKPAPQFSLQDRHGTTYTNDSLKGKNVVLFFNEGIMCYPACWNQMVALPQLNDSNTIALSVVIDQPSDWQSAIQKMPELGNATVLFDTQKAVSNEFGMLTVNSSMHYGSYPGHTFVVIDKQGIVRYVFDDPNMGIDNDKITSELATLH